MKISKNIKKLRLQFKNVVPSIVAATKSRGLQGGLIVLIVVTVAGFFTQQQFEGIRTYQAKMRDVAGVATEPTLTSIPTNTPIPIPTSIPTSMPIVEPTSSDWGETTKLDDKTSASRFAADDHMSTVDELNQAMNQYRQAHGLPTLNFDSLLCSIAQTRANQLLALGRLDYHAGFSALAHSQQTYDTMDEVLFGGVQPVVGVHIVEWGWDKSLTGHYESISDPRWHDGCAGIAGYFAVFIFGER